MVTRTTVTHEDAASITVTGGAEFGDREISTVQPDRFNRDAIVEKLTNGIAILEADHDTVDTADLAQMKTIVKHLLKGLIWDVRLQLGMLDTQGPDA